ncbi:MAG: hypothetical protein IKA74_03025 [Clostridia bacterium]|nr:hypothetical protein [Clostridia bacterium]
MDEMIFEPANAYDAEYKAKFAENAEKMFDDLVKTSGIDVEQNRTTAAEYRKKSLESSGHDKKLSGQKTKRVLLIILAVLLCVLIVPTVLIIVYIVKKLNPKIREMSAMSDKLNAQEEELLARARAQMSPLLSLFDETMPPRLIEQTVPLLDMDKYYDMRRFDYLSGKYGFEDSHGSDASTLGIISGQIMGNPFVFERYKQVRMGTHTYVGNLTISWVEVDVDSKGRRITRRRTQVLTATLEKPKPIYSTHIRLIYGNDAAPNLSFSRTATDAEKMNEKELERYVNRGAKKLRKKAVRSLSTGFTEMGNADFDVLFGAADRDNEVEFRLLFTPLAQKNLVDIITGGTPYGDDFAFTKRGCLNYIMSEHSQTRDYEFAPQRYFSYDIDECRRLFLQYTADDFQCIYFDLAPLISIPLYQQHKPKEYIYKESYLQNYTTRESEVLANTFPSRWFANDLSATDSILKSEILAKHDGTDTVEITAYSFTAESRVDFVPVWGGDGRLHSVPVHWMEYIPVERRTRLNVTSDDNGNKPANAQACVSKHGLFAYID